MTGNNIKPLKETLKACRDGHGNYVNDILTNDNTFPRDTGISSIRRKGQHRNGPIDKGQVYLL